MNFLSGKPWKVTAAQTKLKFSGKGLNCALCGHKFNAGDIARFIYANGTPGAGCGNFYTCTACDGPDVLERGINDYNRTVTAAKRWDIYGPDWI